MIKVGLIDSVLSRITAGGTTTYLKNYVLPGSEVNDNFSVKVMRFSKRTPTEDEDSKYYKYYNYKDITPSDIEEFDLIMTTDVFAVGDYEVNKQLYETIAATDVPLYVTVHSTPRAIIKNKWQKDHRYNFMTHPNMTRMMIFRSIYDEGIFKDYVEEHPDVKLKYTSVDDPHVSHHKPIIAYIDKKTIDDNMKDLNKRNRSVSYMGRTSSDLKYYTYLRMIKDGLADTATSFDYCSNVNEAGYWDQKKYNELVGEIHEYLSDKKQEFNVHEFHPSDIGKSIKIPMFYIFPGIDRYTTFPTTWGTQEISLFGSIPIMTSVNTGQLPEELSFLSKFIYPEQHVMAKIPFDDMTSSIDQSTLIDYSNQIHDYAMSHFYGTYNDINEYLTDEFKHVLSD